MTCMNTTKDLDTKTAAEQIPIEKKLNLTIKEAAAYSNIGINRIDAMLREDGCPFVLFVGSKKLVKRQAFEAFIAERFAV